MSDATQAQRINLEGHTPGPWLHTALQDTIWANDGDVMIAHIADLPRDERGKSQWVIEQANARLIAAAPTLLAQRDALLAALRDIMEHVQDDDGISSLPIQRERIATARAAIALAGGGK